MVIIGVVNRGTQKTPNLVRSKGEVYHCATGLLHFNGRIVECCSLERIIRIQKWRNKFIIHTLSASFFYVTPPSPPRYGPTRTFTAVTPSVYSRLLFLSCFARFAPCNFNTRTPLTHPSSAVTRGCLSHVPEKRAWMTHHVTHRQDERHFQAVWLDNASLLHPPPSSLRPALAST